MWTPPSQYVVHCFCAPTTVRGPLFLRPHHSTWSTVFAPPSQYVVHCFCAPTGFALCAVVCGLLRYAAELGSCCPCVLQVCGDIHGQHYDLIELFKVIQHPTSHLLVFSRCCRECRFKLELHGHLISLTLCVCLVSRSLTYSVFDWATRAQTCALPVL